MDHIFILQSHTKLVRCFAGWIHGTCIYTGFFREATEATEGGN